MPASNKTKQIVWIKDGGRCAICRDILCISNLEGTFTHLIGEIAHIVAEENLGPRGDSKLTIDERNSELNLVLLCQKHHKIIDDDPATHTIEVLNVLTAAHRRWVKDSLTNEPRWTGRLFHFYYINVPRLSLLASLDGLTLDLSEFGNISSLHKLGWELNRLMGGFKQLIQRMELKATPIENILADEDPVGRIISFDNVFRTKNINLPGPDQTYATLFTGDDAIDPHIYTRLGARKWVLKIDTRWVTTTTAFCQFRPSGGINRFAGVGFINSLDAASDVVSITPYFLGMPSTPHLEALYAALGS